jgi:hypothetical protein
MLPARDAAFAAGTATLMMKPQYAAMPMSRLNLPRSAIMKPLVLAAALAALSIPAGLVQAAEKPSASDAAGASASVPDAVKAYVKKNAGTPYPYSGGVQVGQTVRAVDAQNAWRPVPDYPQYSWGNLNGQLVVVDNTAKKVVAVF